MHGAALGMDGIFLPRDRADPSVFLLVQHSLEARREVHAGRSEVMLFCRPR